MKLLFLTFAGAMLLQAAGAVLPDAAPAIDKPVRANALLIRCRMSGAGSTTGELSAVMQSGPELTPGKLRLINRIGAQIADFELPLPSERMVHPEDRVRLTVPDGSGLTVESVTPVLFRKNDLSVGIDFETPENSGIWLAGAPATLRRDPARPVDGKYSLQCFWPGINDTITFYPGERDWSKYAQFRFRAANPMPTALGRRTRITFLFDGRTQRRMQVNDSFPQGAIELLEESGKTFKLDLIKLKANNPQIDLANITAFQIGWSPRPCGETTFYLDDFRLLTTGQLAEEETAFYRKALAELRDGISPGLAGELDGLERRFQSGERLTLHPEIIRLQEKMTALKLSAGAPFRLLAADATVKVMRTETFQAEEFPYSASAAGNERESFQLVVAPSVPLRNVRVSASSPEGPGNSVLPASAVSVNVIGYVEVTDAVYYPTSRTGFWPDVLQMNRPLDLPLRLQPYMVTVAVPAGQHPGVYRGTLTVEADGVPPQSVAYSVRVYDFSLPVRGELKTFFSCGYLPKDREVRRSVYDLCFDYRISPTNMYARISRETGRAPRIIPPLEDLPYCISRGMNFFCYGELLNRTAKDPFAFDDSYIAAAINWVGEMRPKLEAAGAWQYAVLDGFDEIMHHSRNETARRLKEAERLTAAIKKAHPDAAIANVGRLMDISPKLMNWWYCEPVPRREFASIAEQGGQVGFYWVYQDPSFMLDLPGIAPRICAWQTFREGADGMGYFSTYRPHQLRRPESPHTTGDEPCSESCNPPLPPDSVDWSAEACRVDSAARQGRNNDGILFYPGKNGTLLASTRLVNIRDGIEDYEYLALLRRLSGPEGNPLLAIPDSIVTVNQGEYTRDSRALRQYRDRVAEAIERLLQSQEK